MFVPETAEGWSRCAAEALLAGLTCLLQPIAGLGDLTELTGQPTPDLHDSRSGYTSAPRYHRRT